MPHKNNHMENVFTNCQLTNKEIFTNEFTKQPLDKLFARLLILMLINGVDRIESAIKNSYTKDDSDKMIQTLNVILKTYK